MTGTRRRVRRFARVIPGPVRRSSVLALTVTQTARDRQSVPQIQRYGKVGIALRRRDAHRPRCVTDLEVAGEPAAFGFVGIDGERLEMPSARVRHVIDAAAEGTAVPTVHDVEDERRMDGDGGMQALRRLPGAKADPGDV